MMAKPGVVLRRPVASTGGFSEHAELPTDLAEEEGAKRPKRRQTKPAKRPAKVDDKAARRGQIGRRMTGGGA